MPTDKYTSTMIGSSSYIPTVNGYGLYVRNLIPRQCDYLLLQINCTDGNNAIQAGPFWLKDEFDNNSYTPTVVGGYGSFTPLVSQSGWYFDTSVVQHPDRGWHSLSEAERESYERGGSWEHTSKYGILVMENHYIPVEFAFNYKRMAGGTSTPVDFNLFAINVGEPSTLLGTQRITPTENIQRCILVNNGV